MAVRDVASVPRVALAYFRCVADAFRPYPGSCAGAGGTARAPPPPPVRLYCRVPAPEGAGAAPPPPPPAPGDCVRGRVFEARHARTADPRTFNRLWSCGENGALLRLLVVRR